MNTNGSEPLKNPRWEAFCQHYAGDCFGYGSRAYLAAGYKIKNEEDARVNASRLLTNVNIEARVKHLREIYRKQLAIDAARILETRMIIAYGETTKEADRLSALKDIERSLGLHEPEKLDVTSKGEKLTQFVFVKQCRDK